MAMLRPSHRAERRAASLTKKGPHVIRIVGFIFDFHQLPAESYFMYGWTGHILRVI